MKLNPRRIKQRRVSTRSIIVCAVVLLAGSTASFPAVATTGKVTKKALLTALKANQRAISRGPNQPLAAQWGAALVALDPSLAPSIAALAGRERAAAAALLSPGSTAARLDGLRSFSADRLLRTQAEGGLLSQSILVAAMSFGKTAAPPPGAVGADTTTFEDGSTEMSADGKGTVSQGLSIAASVDGDVGPVQLTQGLKISGSSCPTSRGTLEFTIDAKNSIVGRSAGGAFADERQVTGKVTVQVTKDSTIGSVKTNLRIQTRQGINGNTPYVDAMVSNAIVHVAGTLGAREPGVDELSGSWSATVSSASVTRSSSTSNVETASASIAAANSFAANLIATYLTQVEYGLRTDRCKREDITPTATPTTVTKATSKAGRTVPVPVLMRLGLAFTRYDIDYTSDGSQFSFRPQLPFDVKPVYLGITPPIGGEAGTLLSSTAIDGADTIEAIRTISGKGATTIVNVTESFVLEIDAVGVAAGQAVTADTMLKVRFKLSKCCFDAVESQIRFGDLAAAKLLSFQVQGPQKSSNAQGQFAAEFSLRLQCSAASLTSPSCPLPVPGINP